MRAFPFTRDRDDWFSKYDCHQTPLRYLNVQSLLCTPTTPADDRQGYSTFGTARFSGSEVNSVSCGTGAERVCVQSSFTTSIRSRELATKYHQTIRGVHRVAVQEHQPRRR
jgi:hypothetical protein